jgi:uncharacterized protein YjdB
VSSSRSLGLALALVACAEAGPDRTPASVTLAPGSATTLASGATLAVAATVANRGGQALTEPVPTWASSDLTVAAVSSAGVITGIRIGTTNITARVGDIVSAPLAITVTPGTASQLRLGQQPAGATSGQAFVSQPVVQVWDAAGNLVTSSSVAVTAEIALGGGTLSGTTTVSAVSGVATFTDLSLRGLPTNKQLRFTSVPLASVSSNDFALAIDPVPTTVTVNPSTPQNLVSGTTLVVSALVRNQDGAILSNVPVTWASGNTDILIVSGTGAVTAQRLGSAKIVAKTATLMSDSLEIASLPIVSYGAADVKVIRLAPTEEVTPVLTAADVFGTPAPGVTATFASRATSVVTVDANGRVRGVAGGAAFVVASTSAGGGDSIYVQVPPVSGPLLRSDVTRIAHRSGDEILVRVVLDTRGATVGAATLSLTWPHDFFIGFLELLDVDVATGGLGTVTETAVNGQVRASFVSSAGVTGVLEVMRVRLRVRASPNPVGRTGWLVLLPQEVVGIDFSSLTSSVTPLRYPLTVSP